jgi:hypothetical protein
MPPLLIFVSTSAAVGGRGGAAILPPLCSFHSACCNRKKMGGAAMAPLVSLHIFSGLAQFCKKPCNPIFNILQKSCSSCHRSGSMFCSAGRGNRTHDLLYKKCRFRHWHTQSMTVNFAHAESKTPKILKPCGRTTQLSTGLHC